MSIEERVAEVRKSLDMIQQYERMVANNNFEPGTIADMKGNAKDICDVVKSEMDVIKSEINDWS